MRSFGPRTERNRLCLVLETSEFTLSSKRIRSDQITNRHGFSQHGDYVFGWKDDSLQRSMDARCIGDACSVLATQTTEEAMKCTIPRTVNENIDGCKFMPCTVAQSSLN
jgi:hypothetical protein